MEKISEMNIKTAPCLSQLRITDMRLTDIVGAPMDYTIPRIDANQGISGYGEVRDFSSRLYALKLERLILGKNPCGINRIFRKIRRSGGYARQGGGISGIEAVLWDLVGKAYGIPVYQMLGGKCRDSIRIYCDTDVGGRHTGLDMGRALRSRMDSGYTMLEMDLGVDSLVNVESALNASLGYVERTRRFDQEELSFGITGKRYADFMSVPHPFTGLSTTETGLGYLEDHVKQARDTVGYETPLAINHIGHVNYQTCLKLVRRLEKFNISWVEGCASWFYTKQWKVLSDHTCIPMCMGEGIFGRGAFHPLIDNRVVSVIHPDVLTAGGIGETPHIIIMTEEKGVAVAVHMTETLVGYMAIAHVCTTAGDNLLTMGYRAYDVDRWDSMVKGSIQPIVDRGWLKPKNGLGLGIGELDDEVLVSHINP